MARWRTALTAGLLVAALAACEDAPEPRVADEPTPSSTPTSTPSSVKSSPTESTPAVPALPDLPAEAQVNSDDGAEAFARWYVELVNYTTASGDTAPITAVSATDCRGCGGLISAVTDVYSGGGRSEGGEWSIGSLVNLPLDHGADWAAYAKGKIASQKVYASDGTSTGYEGTRMYFYAYAAWTDSGWTMRYLNTPEPA